MNKAPRYKRRDPHPTNAGLLFFRYNRGCEIWVTPEQLHHSLRLKHGVDKRSRSKPENKEKSRKYVREYQRQPQVKAHHSAYWKQSHVRQRVRDNYKTDPAIIEKRKQSGIKKAERASYLQSPEYLAIRAARCKSWRERNMDKKREYERVKHQTDVNYKLAKNLRNRIGAVLRGRAGAVKMFHTEQLIGCSREALSLHLQSQFKDGMTNEDLMAGRIHIDHHIPCAMFDLADVKNQLICFNFKNLKPMWAKDNLRKSDFIEHEGKRVRAREVRNVIPFTKAA